MRYELPYELALDLRSAFRGLRRAPAFTVAALISLGLGIGTATLTFGILDTLLLRPLPLPRPESLVAVRMHAAGASLDYGQVSLPDAEDLRAAGTSFESSAIVHTGFVLTILGVHGPEIVQAAAVTPDFFPMLGVRPQLGRTLLAAEDVPGAPPVLVVSDDLWRRRLGGDPAVLGRVLIADEIPFRVIGVMPPDFHLPTGEEAWIAFQQRPRTLSGRAVRRLSLYARLRPGVPLSQAREEMETAAGWLADRFPATNAGWRAGVVLLREAFLPTTARPILFTLAGAAAGILLIACANLINLLVAHSGARARELAVRAAFGAGPGRLAAQLLTESALLALAGGLLGLGLAAAGLHQAGSILAELLPPPHPSPDLRAAAACGLFTLAAWLLFGLPGALRESRPDLGRRLKGGTGIIGIAGQDRHGGRSRALIAFTEVALATLLLLGTALSLRSLRALAGESGGLRAERLLTLRLNLPGERYRDPEAIVDRAADVVRRLRSLPGVEAASVSGDVPLSMSGSDDSVEIEGRRAPPGGMPRTFFTGVTADYFDVLGIAVREGRTFTAEESFRRAPAAVVNEAFVRRHWPDGRALGRRIRLPERARTGWLTVVGVTADVRQSDLRGDPVPSVYLPFAYFNRAYVVVMVRTRSDPQALAPAVERRIHASDPRLPVYNVLTMRAVRSASLALDHLWSQSFAVFGAVALLLAVTGVYGVLSGMVQQRRREIGVRLALGAQRGQVLRQIVGPGFGLALAGLATGLLAALVLGRLLAPLLYRVSPADPVSFAFTTVLVVDVAFVACWLPARRALEIEPAEALGEAG